MHDKKLGRNPFEKSKVVIKPAETVLFQDVIKPTSDIEKIKEMQIRVDWTEFYQSLAKGVAKFFLGLSFIYILAGATGCSTGMNSSSSDLKKQIVELQKTLTRQATTIEELNNKIYLLSDRVEHSEKSLAEKSLTKKSVTPKTLEKAVTKKLTTSKSSIQKTIEPKAGDLKIYEMALKDLKNKSYDHFIKKVDLLVKGFKTSPLTNNALYLLGEYHFKNKKYLLASQTFEKLYSLSPDGNKSVMTLYMLGLSYEKQGRMQEAKEAYQTVMNIYPGSSEAINSSKKLTALNMRTGK